MSSADEERWHFIGDRRSHSCIYALQQLVAVCSTHNGARRLVPASRATPILSALMTVHTLVVPVEAKQIPVPQIFYLRAITAVVPLLAQSANYQISPSPQVQQMSLYVTDSISGGNLGLCSVYDRNRCTQGPQSLTTLCYSVPQSTTPF